MSKTKLNTDEICDTIIFLVVYASPFTGKTYNLDYTSQWNLPSVTFPPLPPPKTFNWDFNWNFNHGGSKNVVANVDTTTTTTDKPTTTSTTVSSKTNSHSGQFGHKNVDVKWSFNFNHGGSATTSTTQTSSTEKPIKDDENERVKEDVSTKNETILDDDDGKAQDNDINPTSKQDH
jgi:hypothetical protein